VLCAFNLVRIGKTLCQGAHAQVHARSAAGGVPLDRHHGTGTGSGGESRKQYIEDYPAVCLVVAAAGATAYAVSKFDEREIACIGSGGDEEHSCPGS